MYVAAGALQLHPHLPLVEQSVESTLLFFLNFTGHQTHAQIEAQQDMSAPQRAYEKNRNIKKNTQLFRQVFEDVTAAGPLTKQTNISPETQAACKCLPL
jgi:hypothetical protein